MADFRNIAGGLMGGFNKTFWPMMQAGFDRKDREKDRKIRDEMFEWQKRQAEQDRQYKEEQNLKTTMRDIQSRIGMAEVLTGPGMMDKPGMAQQLSNVPVAQQAAIYKTMNPKKTAADWTVTKMDGPQGPGQYLVNKLTAEKKYLGKAAITDPLTKVDVNIGEKSFTELGKEQAKEVVSEYSKAKDAVKGLEGLIDAENLVNKGIITGFGANWKITTGKALQSMGIKVAEDPIANTEAYAAMMGNQVAQIIKQFGAGTGLSDADREYAAKIAGGEITLTEQSLKKIIAINKKAYRNVLKRHNERAKKIMDKAGADNLIYNLMIDVPDSLMIDSSIKITPEQRADELIRKYR